MRVPLSWLRDFAPFPTDADTLVATLDDLGLVVEGVERVGEGLERSSSPGSTRSRRSPGPTASGSSPSTPATARSRSSAARTTSPSATSSRWRRSARCCPAGSRSPGARCGASSPTGCSARARSSALSDDQAGLLLLTEVEGARPGLPVAELLGIEPDVVFDITVEGNRPDAWCVAGIARDLAARLGLAFSLPDPAPVAARRPGRSRSWPSLVVEDTELCPRMTVRVLPEVAVGPSPRWLARRLVLAGHAADQQRRRRLQLRHARARPADPPLRPRPAARRRAARPAGPGGGDGRHARRRQPDLGTPGRGLGDTGEDCLICDADGRAGRHRRGHGRRVVGDLGDDDPGAAGGGVLHADGDRPDVEAARPAHRGVRPVRAGLRPVGHRPGGRPVLRAVGVPRRARVTGRAGRRAPVARPRRSRRPGQRGPRAPSSTATRSPTCSSRSASAASRRRGSTR